MRRLINIKNLTHFFQSPKNLVGFLVIAIFLWFASGAIHKTKVQDVKKEETPLFSVETMDSLAVEKEKEVISRGSVNATKSIQLRAETPGEVLEILKPKGSIVKKGEVILRLKDDDRPQRLSEAKAKLEQRKLEFDASKKLLLKAFASKTNLAESKSQLESAEAALAKVEQEIEHSNIVAPFDGIFDQTSLDVGSILSINEVIGTFINLEKVKVVLNISEKDASLLRLGGTAELVSPYNEEKKTKGEIKYISHSADARVRTYRVEIEADNPNMLFYDGMTAEARIPVEKVLAHLVNFSLLNLDEKGNTGVKAVNDKGEVLFYIITPLKMETGKLWISGLPQKLELITVGQDFVKPGQKVIPKKTQPE